MKVADKTTKGKPPDVWQAGVELAQQRAALEAEAVALLLTQPLAADSFAGATGVQLGDFLLPDAAIVYHAVRWFVRHRDEVSKLGAGKGLAGDKLIEHRQTMLALIVKGSLNKARWWDDDAAATADEGVWGPARLARAMSQAPAPDPHTQEGRRHWLVVFVKIKRLAGAGGGK